MMQIRKATRQHAKIRCAIQGPSGSGKTMGALQLAYGLCSDWNKVCLIDTENTSSDLYAHLGPFNVLPLDPPYHPEKFIAAVDLCVHEHMEVVIIDSLSHEWEGIGGILDLHSQMPGNSFTNWGKLTPRHNALVTKLLQSPLHVLSTIRSKQDYILADKGGKMVPEKVGMKGVQREGMDYEFTIVFELDIKHFATTTKDRTSLFSNQPPRVLDVNVGKEILAWCNTGSKPIDERIRDCKTVQELLNLYKMFSPVDQATSEMFTGKRIQIEQAAKVSTASNGTYSTNS